jgi:N-methylhydantoinase B/oxoprolinase/acetone carboxylase alpha subunit
VLYFLLRKGCLRLIKEDLSIYKDGEVLNENDIATVTAHFEDITIFQDDGGNIYYCDAEPDAFDIGTIAPIDELISIENADKELKAQIHAAV